MGSHLSLCGEPIDNTHIIEQFLSTFYVVYIVLTQQYQNTYYIKYYDLMSLLSLAKKHDELFFKT